MDKQFAKWLTDEMQIQGINRNRLAKKSELSISTIRRCVLGIGSPSLFIVEKILDVLGKTITIIDKEDINDKV